MLLEKLHENACHNLLRWIQAAEIDHCLLGMRQFDRPMPIESTSNAVHEKITMLH